MPTLCRHCASIQFNTKSYASVLVTGGTDGLASTLDNIESRIVPCVTAICPKCEHVSVLSDGSTESLLCTLYLWQTLRPWIDVSPQIMELYDPNHPAIHRPKSPNTPPPGHKFHQVAAELRSDAKKFTGLMENTIFLLEATRSREITATVDYLKAAETDEHNTTRLNDLHEEVCNLNKESKERFELILSALKQHHAFLLDVAKAVDSGLE